MFPFFRLAKDILRARNLDPLAVTETHISHHRCLPWDLDLMAELNNGRALTLYDLGRLVLAKRVGLIRSLMDNKWGLTMAGSSVRYRRRIRNLEKFETRSRLVCWDDRFFYLEQSMWKTDGACASHVLYRAAVTDKNGIVSPDRVKAAMGINVDSPPMPDWVSNWCDAEATRPWPPMQDSL
jgi:acyl-CoA thioesterase FadM